jgi:hypothetical protein
MQDLNDVIPQGSGTALLAALGISTRGQIVAIGLFGDPSHPAEIEDAAHAGPTHMFVLTP